MSTFRSKDPFDRWLEAVVALVIQPVVDFVRRCWQHACRFKERHRDLSTKPDKRHER